MELMFVKSGFVDLAQHQELTHHPKYVTIKIIICLHLNYINEYMNIKNIFTIPSDI